MQQALVLALRHLLVGDECQNMPHEPESSKVHPSHERATLLLSESKGLLDRFASLSERVVSSEGSRLNKRKWGGEFTRLRRIITDREDQVKGQIQGLLSMNKSRMKQESGQSNAIGAETEKWDCLIARLSEGQGEASDTTSNVRAVSWGSAARQTRKGVKRLAGYLAE